MPFRSKAQAAMFYAKAGANPHKERLFGDKGPSKAVAQKFIADSAGQKTADLPERVAKK